MSKNDYKSRFQFSPRFESLESRELMTVTYHGGPLLQHVETQAVYYGQDWYSSQGRTVAGQLDGSLKNIVNSSYMDMLTAAGYGVGRGTDATGQGLAKNINKYQYLNDSQIQNDLQSMISSGNLQAPDANRLYVVYVEPGVAIKTADGSTSTRNFLGYHSDFVGRDRSGHATYIHYAVIAYPGGWNPSSAQEGFRTNLDQLTEVTSHELAEAVTDPNVGTGQIGWYDNRLGEIGDIANLQKVVLNGYCVQKEASQTDVAMTPAGAYAYSPYSGLAAPVVSSIVSAGEQFHTNVVQSDTEHALPASGNASHRLEAILHQNESALATLTNELLDRTGGTLTHMSAGLVDRVFSDFSAEQWN